MRGLQILEWFARTGRLGDAVGLRGRSTLFVLMPRLALHFVHDDGVLRGRHSTLNWSERRCRGDTVSSHCARAAALRGTRRALSMPTLELRGRRSTVDWSAQGWGCGLPRGRGGAADRSTLDSLNFHPLTFDYSHFPSTYTR